MGLNIYGWSNCGSMMGNVTGQSNLVRINFK